MKYSGPDHPISVIHNPHRVIVSLGGNILADSRSALTLKEASYPPVQYIPFKDIRMNLLKRTDHKTYCPYKGECSYYSIVVGEINLVNAVWVYEDPYDAVSE